MRTGWASGWVRVRPPTSTPTPVATSRVDDLFRGGLFGDELFGDKSFGDDLAVDQRRREVERFYGTGQRTKFVRPVQAATRIYFYRFATDCNERAISVIFDLVHPFIANRYIVDQCCKLRLDEARHSLRSGFRPPLRLADPSIMRVGCLHPVRECLAICTFQRLRAGDVPGDLRHGAVSQNTCQRALDQIAYIRFASVYREFGEAKDFEAFAGTVEEVAPRGE